MEFIFENPLILAALVWIVSSLFGGKKKKQQQEQQQKKQRPVEKPPTIEEQGYWETFGEPEEQSAEVRARETAAQMEAQYEEQKRKAQKKVEELQRKQREVPARVSTARFENKQYAEKKPNTSLAPSKQNLADAVIWSEILGPPRARNPHRAYRRK